MVTVLKTSNTSPSPRKKIIVFDADANTGDFENYKILCKEYADCQFVVRDQKDGLETFKTLAETILWLKIGANAKSCRMYELKPSKFRKIFEDLTIKDKFYEKEKDIDMFMGYTVDPIRNRVYALFWNPYFWDSNNFGKKEDARKWLFHMAMGESHYLKQVFASGQESTQRRLTVCND